MRLASALVAAVALAACEKESPPAPAPPPPPPESETRPSTEPVALSEAAPTSVTITQIMLIYRLPNGGKAPRTRAEAYALAKSLIERTRGGARMETLLPYTDDRDESGAVFNDGSYTLAMSSPAIPAVKRVAFSTPVGQVAPEPVDAGYAFLVIRRDA